MFSLGYNARLDMSHHGQTLGTSSTYRNKKKMSISTCVRKHWTCQLLLGKYIYNKCSKCFHWDSVHVSTRLIMDKLWERVQHTETRRKYPYPHVSGNIEPVSCCWKSTFIINAQNVFIRIQSTPRHVSSWKDFGHEFNITKQEENVHIHMCPETFNLRVVVGRVHL
jgi:hypothetical protein